MFTVAVLSLLDYYCSINDKSGPRLLKENLLLYEYELNTFYLSNTRCLVRVMSVYLAVALAYLSRCAIHTCFSVFSQDVIGRSR